MVKVFGLALLFGLLSVATVVAGAIFGIILAVLTPIAIVFTGLWGIWFITKNFEKDRD
jgi:uncharacterized membrane protein YuzA (DUF378 family)